MTEVICTGCGHLGAPPTPPALSCCPEREPVSLYSREGDEAVAVFTEIKKDRPEWLSAVAAALKS
jgi:hypothetical protein